MTLCDCGLLSYGQQKSEDRWKASARMSDEVCQVNYSLKEREVNYSLKERGVNYSLKEREVNYSLKERE
eukprot:12070089-Heterocapsa_arctica.AAC.1